MTVVTALKKTLVSGFLSLPVLFLLYIGFLSMGLASVNLFLLFIGTVTVLPLTVLWLHRFGDPIFTGVLATVLSGAYYGISAANAPKGVGVPLSTAVLLQIILTAVGGIIHAISDGGAGHKKDTYGLTSSAPFSQNVSPSFWVAIVVFIMTYMLSNALSIYTMPAAEGAEASKVTNRKGKAFMLMMNLVLMMVLLLGLRYVIGAETLPGLGVAILVIGPLAYSWQQLTALCGAAPGDIFGIVQRMLPATAAADVPKICTYTK